MKPGIWLLASLNSHGTTKGMRVKFQDVKCYRDYQYEYIDYDNSENKKFNTWSLPSLEEIRKNEVEAALEAKTHEEIDVYTDTLANELGLRSLKQQSNSSEVDLLDLSYLDYEVVDVSNDTQPHFTKTQNKTVSAEINGQNDTSLSTRMDGQNLTGVDFLNQLISKNSTALQNSSASAFEDVTNVTRTLTNLTASDSNVTSLSAVDVPADGMKPSLSAPKENVGKNSSINGNSSSSQEAHGPHFNSSEEVNPLVSDSENTTDVLLKNSSATANLSASHVANDELERIWSLQSPSNETVVSGIPDLSNNEIVSEEEVSEEEVLIFSKDQNAGVIKTTSVKTSGHNWTYDATHQISPMEIPDDMKKYFEKSTQTNQKKMRKVIRPHRPQRGQGMKTKRKKEYKPQPKTGLPFSPRGFNPNMSPRGARPQTLQLVNDKENLINMPVVIGVPRPDFSDYELYLPGDEPDHLGLDEKNVKANEYEYISYKDPYSSDESAKNFHHDQAKKYLESADKDVRTYFIAAEEVRWDYAGYGQR